MRFHVVGLPHTQTTKKYVHCAYTEKVRKFCDMMMAQGHEVFLYASEENQAKVTELITCITKKEQRDLIGIEKPTDNGKAEFKPGLNYWQLMNKRASVEINKRRQPKDFICLIAGLCQKPIADDFPDMMSVEFGIGYGGVFAKYKVFESYAWMHMVYGALAGDPHQADGNFFDTVIPNYYDPKDFPLGKKKGDYCLFMGRLIDRKGYGIAVQVCKELGVPLKIAGQGEAPDYGEYLGVVGVKERGKLMSRARAVFVPTQYVEPFGGVAAEAMLCGTPVITTDWGAFTETNIHGVTGFRCRTFKEFCDAVAGADRLNYENIRDYAIRSFGMENVAIAYETYFERLLTLWEDGWYTKH